MKASLPYVPYSPQIETIPADEARITAEILKSMADMIKGQFAVHRHGLRDAHAKGHGALKGTLTVYDKIPDHLKQGLFAKAADYPAIVRLSTSPSTIQPDSVNCLRAFAIKVIGVSGTQLLPERAQAVTQDFLMVNSTFLPFPTLESYLKAQKLNEAKINQSEAAKLKTVKIAKAINGFLKLIGRPHPLLTALTSPHTHIVGETYNTAGVIRFGQFFGKLSLVPLSANAKALANVTFDPSGKPDVIRDHVKNFFARQGADYELRIQLCTDVKKMPAEDPSIIWQEALSAPQAIAKLSFPAQDALSERRRQFVDDVLTFNPWHGIEDHRPLGALMRVRRPAYEQSSRLRHELNKLDRFEPKTIQDIPD